VRTRHSVRVRRALSVVERVGRPGKSERIRVARALQYLAAMGNELKDRVEAKKHELLAKYNELKADNRAEAREQESKVKLRLDEIEGYMKEGWDKAQVKINEWLNRKKDTDN
jgi:hypothetical protein